MDESIMEQQGYYAARQVYPTDKGLHFEFSSPEHAMNFFKDGTERGISYELDGCTVIKPFKVKRQSPIPDESGIGRTG
jgi:hypothetical protein